MLSKERTEQKYAGESCLKSIAFLRAGDRYGWDLPCFLLPALSVGMSGAHSALFLQSSFPAEEQENPGSRVQLGELAELAGVQEAGSSTLGICLGAWAPSHPDQVGPRGATSHLGWTEEGSAPPKKLSDGSCPPAAIRTPRDGEKG